MFVLHEILCFLLLLSGAFVCFSRNPVESVLFLILGFCNAAAILILFNVDFLALVFVIIYVGAIAVLFLFVIMMLNIKDSEITISKSSFYLPRIFFYLGFAYLLSLLLFLILSKVFNKEETFLMSPYDDLFLLVDDLSNIDILGQHLFNSYLICVLIAGLILLIALIGAIILTLRFNKVEESQQVNRQLSRSDSFLSFHS